MRAPAREDPERRRVLDSFLLGYDHAARIPHDPVRFPRAFPDPRDAEVAAFLASSLAFGRVAAFSTVVERILAALGPHPAAALREGAEARWVLPVGALRYRWLSGADLQAFLGAVADALRAWESLEALAARGVSTGGDAASALVPFLGELRARAQARAGGGPPSPGLRFLLPEAAGGAACKRQHLFLRWMVRRGTEGVDLGLWSCLSPSALLIPLDTHVFRIGRALGLTERLSPGLAAAREVTGALARLDPQDPVKYDFALCHLGVSGRCLGRKVEKLCAPCALREVCRLG